ncbi:bifunctional UDP-sugar hydrolase/5'-nucleotidase [Shewanella sp. SR44-3]|uniref:bifunctional metallophosphatase/5'-nucleotidase n=2 Tax=unclassified Shewanella TaxID=196818 RepID=UPI0015FB7B3C|nr:5'-nucleotidase C-terminal domain-containing protein [Shewanella sp. SR44-3]MBB1268149.1 5'-nucleotidase C-terminal domain-containing protein [Shewanella sp. SR44-3]
MNIRYTLSLAHINDTHSNFEASTVQFSLEHQGCQYKINTKSGGYARLSFQISQARLAAQENTMPFLFLHAGDSFQGTLYFREFQGSANAHLLNLLAPDAMVLGNHEIDAGNGPVQAFLNRIEFPLLAGNMDLSQEELTKPGRLAGHPMLYDYDAKLKLAKVILKPFHDTQLAIIGITLDQMALIARPDPDTHFVDAIATTARTVAHLKAQGIHHIVVLSHLGLDQDRELANSVPGISLIVGGHSHTLQGDFNALGLSQLAYGERQGGTAIVHAGKYAETLGLANIEFDQAGKLLSLTGNNFFMLGDELTITSATDKAVPRQVEKRLSEQLRLHPGILNSEQDDALEHIIQTQYRPALDALESQVLGQIPRDFVHTRLPSRHHPHGSEIAPWISRSMYKMAKKQLPELDFSLHNAGGVRQSLPKGQITMADVLGRILPFELPLVAYQIKGRHLFEVLENCINAATNNGATGTGAGSFPYPYGIRYFYDGTQALGQRITKIELHKQGHWQDISADEHYTGVSTAYTASGKEGYHGLLNALWFKPLPKTTLPEAFVDFMGNHGHLLTETLTPNVYYIRHIHKG